MPGRGTLAQNSLKNPRISNETDSSALQIRTKQLLLLARVREKSGNIPGSLNTLKEARENQYKLQKRISIEQPGSLLEHYKVMSKICTLLAEQSISLRENEQALQYYKEALKFSPEDVQILCSLGRLYMQMNLMDLCRDICSQILRIDSNNETASVMMAGGGGLMSSQAIFLRKVSITEQLQCIIIVLGLVVER
uniref:Tetratricopeptide repeat protein 21A/21B fourth ARM domain-containing protein n=1 Tax=Megaselia scalaris TaxID=36166 RepID=T1GGC8_MEGSC